MDKMSEVEEESCEGDKEKFLKLTDQQI